MTEEEAKNSKDPETPEPQDSGPDRPLECSQCQKPIAVRYTEIVGNCKHTVIMCSDCPNLKQRLQGIASEDEELKTTGPAAGLSCGNCGSTWQAIKMGHPLGCSECYDVFDKLLLDDLISTEAVPKRLAVKQRGVPAHVGRAPGEAEQLNPQIRLMALNDALNETLSREDYEQAAWIRDQIKELNEEKGSES